MEDTQSILYRPLSPNNRIPGKFQRRKTNGYNFSTGGTFCPDLYSCRKNEFRAFLEAEEEKANSKQTT